MIDNVRKYMGIPYLHHGRSADGMDCYGVIGTIFENEKGIKVNDFPYEPKVPFKDINNLPVEKAGWSRVDLNDLKPFDIIVFRNLKFIGQVGMYLGDNMFIHTSKKTGSLVTELSAERKRRIIGVYRWAG